jgi:hypothetical protein
MDKTQEHTRRNRDQYKHKNTHHDQKRRYDPFKQH